MIEQIFKLTQGNEKTIEKVIIDENIHYMHMILNKGECLPEHFSNAKNVYITVVRGTLSVTSCVKVTDIPSSAKVYSSGNNLTLST